MKRLSIVAVVFLCAVQSLGASRSKTRVPKEPKYRSENPLYFRLAFGKMFADSMLGVMDESNGSGSGYDVVWLDENMDNDLTNETPKKFPTARRKGGPEGEVEARFSFKGPLGEDTVAEYEIHIYRLAQQLQRAKGENKCHFFWRMKSEGWSYFFINGRMRFYSSAADALKREALYLAGNCKWDISSRTQGNAVIVSAGLKDANGCTLRILSGPTGQLAPKLSLLRDGEVVQEEKMTFG